MSGKPEWSDIWRDGMWVLNLALTLLGVAILVIGLWVFDR